MTGKIKIVSDPAPANEDFKQEMRDLIARVHAAYPNTADCDCIGIGGPGAFPGEVVVDDAGLHDACAEIFQRYGVPYVRGVLVMSTSAERN